MKKLILLLLLVIPLVGGQQECIIPPASESENIIIIRVKHTATTLNDEYIVLFNTGSTAVDISGWVVFSSVYQEYRTLSAAERGEIAPWKYIYKIPSWTTLYPKHWVRICSGRGKDNELYLYRNLSEQWLNNEGDTVYLMDNYCNIIDEYSW
ncbi:MAG: lamin tail domain-containing protein [Candidatus Methanofastidiosia archaeon]|jgi:hypothetical protein